MVDGLDAVEELVWRDVCRSQGWPSIEAPGYGKVTSSLIPGGVYILKGLDYMRRQRGMTVVLLAHSAIETINDPRACKLHVLSIALCTKRARGLVQDWCDAIGFLRAGSSRPDRGSRLRQETESRRRRLATLATL